MVLPSLLPGSTKYKARLTIATHTVWPRFWRVIGIGVLQNGAYLGDIILNE